MQRYQLGDYVIFTRDDVDPNELARVAASPALVALHTRAHRIPCYTDGVVLTFVWFGPGPSPDEGVAACRDPFVLAHAEPDGLTRAQRIRRGLSVLLAYWRDAEIDQFLAPLLPACLFERTPVPDSGPPLIAPAAPPSLAQRVRADDPDGLYAAFSDEELERCLLARWPTVFRDTPRTRTPADHAKTCDGCGAVCAPTDRGVCARCVDRLSALLMDQPTHRAWRVTH